jgi:hypothetical protein
MPREVAAIVKDMENLDDARLLPVSEHHEVAW